MIGRTAARALLAGLIGLGVSVSALAGRGHSGGGHSGHFAGSGGGHFHHRVFIGGAFYAPFYFPPPYYYYPQPYYYPPPAQYVEPYPAPSAPQSSSWYYCSDSRAYYPYVQQCPSGWQQVAPQPPS